MKSWLKALLISAVILASCIFYLPTLVKQGLNSVLPWLMQQADLEQGELNIDQLSWYKLSIDQMQLYSPAIQSRVQAQGLTIEFSPWALLGGNVKQVHLESARIELAVLANGSPAANEPKVVNKEQSVTPAANDNSAEIHLVSLQTLFQQLPVDNLILDKLEIIHPQASIQTQLNLNQHTLVIQNEITSSLFSQPLSHELTINSRGQISSRVFLEQGQSPIFNLQANWSEATDLDNIMQLSIQQSADIQSWLALGNQKEKAQSLEAKIAIQAWNLELLLPTKFSSVSSALRQLKADGLWQVKIDDFSIFDSNKQAHIIEQADLAINLTTTIDHQRKEQVQFSLDTFDLTGSMNKLAAVDVQLEQHLEQAINIGCSFLADTHHCQWQGALKQSLSANNLSHNSQLNLEGEFNNSTNSTGINNTNNEQHKSHFISRQSITLNTLQENALWPKGQNTSHGDIIFQGQHINNDWHWQLSLPYGLNNQSQYLDKILLAEGNKKTAAQLSPIHWQLLPDWQVSGINGEITGSKDFALIIDQLKFQHNKREFALDHADIRCNLDWLKLQYSPQLRSQQALSELPLSCHWRLNNKLSQWQQWPLPAFTFAGELGLTSLDLSRAKLDTQMKFTGLGNSLDLTLLAQHDFSALQQGSAQLYLNNFKLDWQAMGLSDMATLTQTQLLDGSLSAQGWFNWQQYQADIFDDSSIAWRWQPDLMVRIDDLSGIYQELTTWEDIDIQLALRRPFYEDYRIDSQFSAFSIHPGIEVANVLARSTATIQQDFSQALIVIEEVHSDVLGGRINVPLIRFDSAQDINSFGIEVEGIEVEQLAALEAGAGINATGRLDGVLPIILLPEGPHVPAGSLFARSPGGIVQYRGQTANSLKESDASVGLAMQVLDDFRYDTLQTDVTYQPDGELNLALQFKGHNPTFFDGQATHFNLNLEYNLLDLLESLRISNDIVQKLENKYQ